MLRTWCPLQPQKLAKSIGLEPIIPEVITLGAAPGSSDSLCFENYHVGTNGIEPLRRLFRVTALPLSYVPGCSSRDCTSTFTRFAVHDAASFVNAQLELDEHYVPSDRVSRPSSGTSRML